MILALDIGTSRAKGGLFTGKGECLATASADLPPPAGNDPLARAADPRDWMRALRTIDSILLAGRIRPDCVVVSGNGPTLLPADASGRALHEALTWMDRRALPEAEEASAACGVRIDSSFYLPKALWFARKRPDLYERTAHFFSCPEYVIRLIAGEAVTVFPGTGYEPLYWKDEWIRRLGMDPAKFPRFVAPGSLVGTTTAAAMDEAGLPEGIPVVAGGPDFLAALAGTATTAPGRACDRAGTSEGINLCSAQGVADPRLLSMPHVIRPWSNISGAITTSGGALEWYRSAAGLADLPYEALLDLAGRAPPGSGGLVFLPYLAGERAPLWDSQARGAFIGLTLAHGRAEMARAVVEATALAIRDIIDVMDSAGARVDELRVTGKPGTSATWNRIKADITGKPILVPRFGEAELLGGACMGFTALGRYTGLAEAAEDLVAIGARFEPDPSTRETYEGLFSAYRESYSALKPIFPRLGEICRKAGGET
jgi:xylulokinase